MHGWVNRSGRLAAALLCAGCAGQQLDARSTYNASQHIVDAAAAGKAAAAQCKLGGDAAAVLCPKVDEAFDDIVSAAKGIQENAKAGGGAP